MDLWRSVRGLPHFWRLLELRTASQFGDGLFQAGLAGGLLFNPDRAAGPWELVGAFAVLYLPYSVLGPFGAEQQPARQAGGEQAVAELTDEPKLEQASKLGKGAYRLPQGERRTCLDHDNPVPVASPGRLAAIDVRRPPDPQYKYPAGPALFATFAGC